MTSRIYRGLSSFFLATKKPLLDERGEFLLIDIEEIKQELRLKERAAENGERNIPGAAISIKDAMAIEIDTYINRHVLSAKDKFAERLRAIDELSKVQSVSLQDMTELYDSAKAELKTLALDIENALFTAKKVWVRGEVEFKAFREEHRRIGPARYPDNKTKTVGWIFLITIIEIMMNAYALGAAHPSGPIGVFVEIFMFGIVNIGVAFLLGNYLWRYFNHINAAKKAVATVLALPMMTFIVFLNFFLAHYRDAVSKLANNEGDALQVLILMQQLGGQAITTLIHNPFLMEDFKSYLLLFVGLIASVFATKKSFELDDPYPGYGKLSREQEELAENFNDRQTSALRDMNVLVEDYSNKINFKLNSVKTSETVFIEREQDKKQLFDKYNNWLPAMQSAGEALYAFYREENMKARKSNIEPKCFSSIHFILSSDAKVKLPPPKPVASNYGTVQKTCKRYLDDLNKQLYEFQEKFKSIEDMSPDEILNVKLKEPTIFKD